MLLPRSWYRRKSVIVCQILVLFAVLLFLHTRLLSSPAQIPASTSKAIPPHERPPNPLLKDQAIFWRALYSIILNNDPQCEHKPDPVVPEKLDVGYDPNVDRPRPDVLWMEPGDIKRMREAHSNFISDLKKAPPQLVYNVGTQGIVMTAGLSQLPVLVISIRMLRRTWSLVPVEVFLSKESDYDAEICDTVLPTLNAKCLLFSDIFHAAESGVPIDRFQFKIMAILFSSFDQVLLLDSDAFPINDPVYMFDKEPFNSTGMIVWPDFWYASESPYYFDIAKIPSIPPLKERAAVESGEIAYSKSKHHLSIMLAAYYNFYGPQYYYPLLSQGAPGRRRQRDICMGRQGIQ